MNEWMNKWMNEWMKDIFNGLLYNLILVEISFWKEQENHYNIYYLYKVYADNSRYYNLYEWIRLGLYNNSLHIHVRASLK